MDAIKESVSQMSQIFNQKMSEFEERQQRITASTSPSVSNLADQFSTFKAFTLNALQTLQSQVELLAQQNDNLETHTRRKILLLHGIPEDINEDTVTTVVELVSQTLKLDDFQASAVSRCHRMGGSSNKDRPRPILFKVRDASIRSKIWATKTKLKGSGVTMSEFLTKARHNTFMAAREKFGVAKCWTREGSVFVLGTDGVRHRISCIEELNKISTPTAMKSSVAKPLPAVVASERVRRVPKPKV